MAQKVFVLQPVQGGAAVPPLRGWAGDSHKMLLCWWDKRGHVADFPGSLSRPVLMSQMSKELSSPPRYPSSLRVLYLQDSRLFAEAREETMGLT